MKKKKDAPDKEDKKVLELAQKLEAAEQEIEGLKETAQRAMADLQNFRRRTEEDKSEFVKFANAGLIQEILPIVDNFKRAFDTLPDEVKKSEWEQGIEHIYTDFVKLLTAKGLSPIETVGEEFDPELHEAMMQGPGEKNIIVQEYEKGYMLGETVLRHAKVMVGNGEKA